MRLTRKNSILGMGVLLIIIGASFLFYYGTKPNSPTPEEREETLAEVVTPLLEEQTKESSEELSGAGEEVLPELKSLEGLSEELDFLEDLESSIGSNPFEESTN